MKVEELEKEILDSRQKIEYYRTKMQELVSTKEFFYASFFPLSHELFVVMLVYGLQWTVVQKVL